VFFGSTGGKHLRNPIVGMAASSEGLGYWELASNGYLFPFDKPGFFGSMYEKPLNQPLVGMAANS